MLRFALGFLYFFRFHFVFLFVKSYVGWEICALASHLHVFCFQLEGGVKKSLRTVGLKKFRTGGWGVGVTDQKYKTRNFQNLIRKRLLRDIETKNKLKFQSATWSHDKHHDTAEFLVCVFSNSTIGIWFGILICIVIWHSNIILDKGLNLFDECAGECVHLFLQEK